MYRYGKHINDESTIRSGLKNIYGLGYRRIEDICSKFGITINQRFSQLDENLLTNIFNYIGTKYSVESELRKKNRLSIYRLSKIRSHRGTRHRLKLPLRGQRTHSNAKTQKR